MNSNALTIGILIPVYNVAEYVEDCIESILSQVDKSAHIILMNDASTDNSTDILNKYITHPQIQIVEAPYNRGLSATRNALLKLAQTEYIWFIDSDDVMHEGAYQAVFTQLNQLKVDVLCADYVSLRGQKEVYKKAFIGKPNNKKTNKNNSFLNNVIRNNSNHVWNEVFRKKVIESLRFKEGINFEDIYYMTDISTQDFSYSYLKAPIIKYRDREGSIVKILDKKYVDDYLQAFVYRVNAYQKEHNEYNKKNHQYLIYKAFKRYLGLLKKIKKGNNPDLLEYVTNKYDDYFLKMYSSAHKDLHLYQRLIVFFKKASK